MKYSNYIAVIFVLGLIYVICLWAIDVSFSAVQLPNGYLTNGFVVQNPLQVYHVALWVTILCFVFMGFIAIHFMEKLQNIEKTIKEHDNYGM